MKLLIKITIIMILAFGISEMSSIISQNPSNLFAKDKKKKDKKDKGKKEKGKDKKEASNDEKLLKGCEKVSGILQDVSLNKFSVKLEDKTMSFELFSKSKIVQGTTKLSKDDLANGQTVVVYYKSKKVVIKVKNYAIKVDILKKASADDNSKTGTETKPTEETKPKEPSAEETK